MDKFDPTRFGFEPGNILAHNHNGEPVAVAGYHKRVYGLTYRMYRIQGTDMWWYEVRNPGVMLTIPDNQTGYHVLAALGATEFVKQQ